MAPRSLAAIVFAFLLAASRVCGAVAISGAVIDTSGHPLCALVLANGQFMFSCSPIGSYALDAPLDSNNQITLFGFADGYFPFKAVLNGTAGRHDIALAPAPASGVSGFSEISLRPTGGAVGKSATPGFTMSAIGARPSASKATVSISGSVKNAKGDPLCALVLANGQFMFSCTPVGAYQLSVPLDSAGQITLFGFADGYFPFKVVLSGASAGHNDLSLRAPGTPSVLESVTQSVSAAQGATLTLPSGSSATIPAGALPTDQVVTLSRIPQLAVQPPSGIVTGSGPALQLTFNSRVSANPAAATDGITFVIRYHGDAPADFSGSAPLADVVDEDSFAGGVPINCDSSSACFVVPLSLIQNAQSISATSGNLSPAIRTAPPAPYGPRIWNGSTWVDFPSGFDPKKKTLLLTHGIFSTVEGAFGPCLSSIMSQGGYQQVVGFDYDWTQRIATGGQKLADFFRQLQSLGLQSIDVQAHSYGTVNALYAASLSDIRINNMILEGGPLKGSPLAVNPEWLMTILANTGVPNNSYVNAQTIRDVRNSGMILDLQPGNPLLDDIRRNALARHPDTNFIKIIGVKSALPSAADGYVFQGTPNDGVMADSSAGANDLPGPANSFPVSHTNIECNPDVLSQVGRLLVNPSPVNNQKANLTPFQPSGWSDKIVVTTSSGSTTDSSSMTPNDELFVDWAVINNGAGATLATFLTRLDVDGVQAGTWHTDPPLDVNHYAYVTGTSIGKLSAGVHTLHIVADSGNAIDESNEQDNEYTKTINITAPAATTVSMTVNDQCNNGNSLYYRFFDETNGGQWPSDTTLAYVATYGQSFTSRLSCSSGAKICLGARSGDGSTNWGVGLNNTSGCSDCCYFCDGGAHGFTLDDCNTPPPPPNGGAVSGTWNGNWTKHFGGFGDGTYALHWSLTQSGSSVSGSWSWQVTSCNGLCPDGVGASDSGTFAQGSMNGSTLNLVTTGGTSFVGTVSGNSITGTSGGAFPGTFTMSR